MQREKEHARKRWWDRERAAKERERAKEREKKRESGRWPIQKREKDGRQTDCERGREGKGRETSKREQH